MKTKGLSELHQVGRRRGSIPNDLIMDHLEALAKIEDDDIHKDLLKDLVSKYVDLEHRVSRLLRNTLPAQVADEIKYLGKFSPRPYECTILFTDIAGFTHLAEKMSGEKLLDLLDELFRGFDDLMVRHRGTKIKTIGDAYMAVFGAPESSEDHAVAAIHAALDMIDFLKVFNVEHDHQLDTRIGIHTGRVMAGVVGRERMQFDVFGDNVNIASRFESSGEKGRINVSNATYLQARPYFEFEERGEIPLKNKGRLRAYFVVGLKEAPDAT